MQITPEQQRRFDELAERKAELDRRAKAALEATREAMRARGEPVRGDFSSRSAYRKAAALYRRRK